MKQVVTGVRKLHHGGGPPRAYRWLITAAVTVVNHHAARRRRRPPSHIVSRELMRLLGSTSPPQEGRSVNVLRRAGSSGQETAWTPPLPRWHANQNGLACLTWKTRRQHWILLAVSD